MKTIYLARANAVGTLQFERAKKIIYQDFPGYTIIYHNKNHSYNPNLIKKADLVVFVTKNNDTRIGKGLRQQLDECFTHELMHTWLNIGLVGQKLTDREYSAFSHPRYIIDDNNEYDERHAHILLTGKSIYPPTNEKKRKWKLIFHSLRGIINHGPLINGDTVNFHYQGKIFTYTVRSKFLDDPDKHNRILLNKLFNNNEYKIFEFLSDAYGYEAKQGNWPECKPDDYDALTRAVNTIYRMLELISEVDEINEEDLQAAADMYDEVVSQDSLYINPLKTKQENGKTIKVQRLTPTIGRGEEGSRRIVHGRGSQTVIRVGHLSNKEVSGYSAKRPEQNDWEEEI